jgi:hypothetical protein
LGGGCVPEDDLMHQQLVAVTVLLASVSASVSASPQALSSPEDAIAVALPVAAAPLVTGCRKARL